MFAGVRRSSVCSGQHWYLYIGEHRRTPTDSGLVGVRVGVRSIPMAQSQQGTRAGQQNRPDHSRVFARPHAVRDRVRQAYRRAVLVAPSIGAPRTLVAPEVTLSTSMTPSRWRGAAGKSDVNNPKEFLTVRDLAVDYAIPESSQRIFRQRGRFVPAYRVGRRLLYRRLDLELWLSALVGVWGWRHTSAECRASCSLT
jgi:hypothetical protein